MTPSRPAHHGSDVATICVPSWLADKWMKLKAEQFHGSIQINFTHGREANANIVWSVFPDGTRR